MLIVNFIHKTEDVTIKDDLKIVAEVLRLLGHHMKHDLYWDTLLSMFHVYWDTL